MIRQISILAFFIIFTSCYTETSKPDYEFMNTIKAQASLDSSLKTTIEIVPKKFHFGTIKKSDSLYGYFFIKNTGKINFNIISIKSICSCIKTTYENTKTIKPNDSLKIQYKMNIVDQVGPISNSIVAIGNCQYGNQTYLFDGSIY